MFESSGEITPPCGVPASTAGTRPRPSRLLGATCAISLITRRSETRSATIDRRLSWSICAEVVPDVGLENELCPSMNDRRSTSFASVADRRGRNPNETGKKVGLEDGLKHDPRGLLNNPVLHGRDAQRPNTTLRLGDLNPPNRQRAITTPHEAQPGSRPEGEPPRAPQPLPGSADRSRQPPCSSAHASTPPTARHCCGSGQTERENAYPATAWRPPIACAEVLAHPQVRQGRRARARRGCWIGLLRPCPNAYLPRNHDQSQGPSLLAPLAATPIITTTTPSDSRCPPLDFTIGLYERSSLTRLGRRVSLVPRSDLARVQLPIPRRDPPHPIRNQDWRTWPSP